MNQLSQFPSALQGIHEQNISRRGFLELLAAGAVVLGTSACTNTITPESPTDITYIQEVPTVANFVDSIGVQTHFNHDGYYSDGDRVIETVDAAGFRSVRDVLLPGNKSLRRRYSQLGERGIRLDGTGVVNPASAEGVARLIKEARLSLNDGVLFSSISSPNEPEAQNTDTNWPTVLLSIVDELYTQAKKSKDLKNIPIAFAPLQQRTDPNIVGPTANVDVGNVHAYYHGLRPEGIIAEAKLRGNINAPEKPVMISETGFASAQRLSGKPGLISERAASIYTLRAVAEAFRLGVKKTVVYALADEAGDDVSKNADTLGLLRTSGEPKPAFRALQNLFTIIKDGAGKESRFNTASLGYTLAGDNELTHHFEFQGSDGKHFIVIWQADKVWDENALVDVESPSQAIKITFPAAVSSLKTYAPTTSSAAQFETNGILELNSTILAELTIIEVTP